MTLSGTRPPSLLVDPLALAAVALMVVNDQWLKAAFHNGWTGKLSDLAVCLFLPLFIAEVGLLIAPRWGGAERWLVTGAGVTVVVFGGLELHRPLASATCQALTVLGPWLGIAGPFEMTRDPTDLLALTMVAPATLYGAHKLRRRANQEVAHDAP